ncbi:MAG: hypothetical protein LBR18_02705 [Tannerella sp.]|jgi:hypothetical protein|nr:hypothetical protein [Tannerella sp.]
MRNLTALLLLFALFACHNKRELASRFAAPQQTGGSVTLYWLNDTLRQDSLHEQIALLHRDGFSGVAPLPLNRKVKPDYLTDSYLELYGFMLNELKKHNMELIFYDDCNFPTGTAGGRFRQLYPDLRIKYLTRIDTALQGGGTVKLPVPKGKLMSACISRPQESGFQAITETVKIVSAQNGFEAQTELPEGKWRIQLFFCCVAENQSIVDYLDPDAVSKLLGLTYEQYYSRFPEHFGTTIKTSFYDDHAYYYVPHTATWTARFNEKFIEKHGFKPDTLYPSLFENTGERDAANRAYLFAFRDELNAKGYPRVVSQWAANHGIACSGHPAATYRPNPLQLMGDGLYYFKYQDVPLCDYIHYFRHGVDGFNIPASAAYNFDKDILICEIYGNFQPDKYDDGKMLYRAGMDVYARGINKLLPHGTWYNAAKVDIIPEISWRNPKMANDLSAYNQWVARCEMLLQHSRHVAQVGILYPIADLRARYNFLDYKPTNGKEAIRGNDYYNFIALMTKKLRTDYTLLHPEILDERCTIKPEGILRLDNERNYEEYQLLIAPWCRTISLSNLKKMKEYADKGGTVLFTGCLPEQATEFGKDEDIKRLVSEMKTLDNVSFIEHPDEQNMRSFINAHILPDVSIGEITITSRPTVENADLPASFRDTDYAYNCIHKVKDGMDCYFFANPTDYALTAEITFGQVAGAKPELWNPHTGTIQKLASAKQDGKIRLALPLPPVSSCFIIFKQK